MLALYTVVLLCVVAQLQAKELPTNFPRCKRADKDLNGCVKNALQSIIPDLVKGVPQLDLAPIDPLHVNEMEIATIPGVKLKLKNIDMTGMRHTKILELKTNMKDSFFFRGGEEKLVIKSDYEMEGTFKGQSVDGKGKATLTMLGLEGTCDIPASEISKDGHRYRQASTFDLKLPKVAKLEINFTGIKDEEKANKHLNDNWQEFWEGLKMTFEPGFGRLWKFYTDSVFLQVPMEKILLE